jgi:hypothetical protein
VSKDNAAAASEDVRQGETQVLQIAGDACFSCWYFIRVEVDSPYQSAFVLALTPTSNKGAEFARIKNGQAVQFTVAAGYAAKGKFMLDSMDHFFLDVSGTGRVEVYVGLDPDTVGPNSYTWQAKSRGGIAQLAIPTTDKDFHLATWYYIYLRAVEEALVTLELKQQRSVEFIPNNHDFTYRLTYGNAELLNQKF